MGDRGTISLMVGGELNHSILGCVIIFYILTSSFKLYFAYLPMFDMDGNIYLYT